MCGLTGFWTLRRHAELFAALPKMTQCLSHRGPDDSGVWTDCERGIGLGHRRLSVVDLSPHGHQPMLSASNRFVLVFNGEIYNHVELRRQVNASGLAPHWRGHSDTETLLAAFEAWGITVALQRSIGMFALALWDRSAGVLMLARDRMGEKPLYYGIDHQTLIFGSELKALNVSGFRDEIDRSALALYMRHNCIPAPYSIYKRIRKLMPGTVLTIGSPDLARGVLPSPSPYWSLSEVAATGQEHPFRGNDADAVDALETILGNAIKRQMIADVPVGAFLSGGVDSATVAALMQRHAAQRIKTFTIGFETPGFNEAVHAKAIAAHLGTDHTELYLREKDALAVVPLISGIYDEPFADSSQIPTFLISRLARSEVTVSLSGDGGDELFGGYNRHLTAEAVYRAVALIPHGLRKVGAGAITSIRPDILDAIFRQVSYLVPRTKRVRNPGDQMHKLADVLAADGTDDIYRTLTSHWQQPQRVVLGAPETVAPLFPALPSSELPSFATEMMYRDQLGYLPNDILVKVDRAAMAVSLETRVPFLDHSVVEFAWTLPRSMTVRNGETKWALRQVLHRYVPKTMVERPKTGFTVPLAAWLRGALRDWAESLLEPSRLRREGYFEPAAISKKWGEHLAGRRNWDYHLWDVLMFQSWLDSRNAVTIFA